MKTIGIDIGASHISCGLFNHNSNELEHKICILNKIDKTKDIEIYTTYFINLIINLIERIIQETKIDINQISSIGLGCPGGIDKENGIFLGSSSLNVNKIDFRKELQKYNIPIFIENDCTCAGICESYIRNIDDFLMLTLGSDIGISYIHNYTCIDEKVWKIMEINNKNNDEQYIRSFHALSEKYSELKKESLSRKDIFEGLDIGDIYAKIILKDYINSFIEGINKIKNEFNIKDIVIGGGMSEHSKYFIHEIREGLPNLNIYIAKLKNDSGIVGSALLQKAQD